MTEAYSQILPDSTGKKIRLIEITTYVGGVPTTVEMETMVSVDGDGRPIDFNQILASLNAMKREGEMQTEILLMILAAVGNGRAPSREEVAALIDE